MCIRDRSNISNLDPEEWSDYVPRIVPSERLALQGVTVKTPRTDNVLVRDLSFSLGNAEGLLVVGPSGCGKTSLLRVVSGLWGSPTGTVYPRGRAISFSFLRSPTWHWDLCANSFVIPSIRPVSAMNSYGLFWIR